MDNTIQLLIKDTLQAVRQLKSEKDKLESDTKKLTKQIILLKEKNEEQEKKIASFNTETHQKEIAKLTGSDAKEIKKELNQLIKIIDKNIATLKTDFMP